MTNFHINFAYPWLFLLLIPALFLTLFPYFRLNKKYRRNRNRIISIVLHTVIMVLCVTVLVGTNITYDTPNSDTEIMLLVDASYSNADAQDAKNDYVKAVIDGNEDRYKIGVVTFGFGECYAAPLDTNGKKVYEQYMASLGDPNSLPDDTATDMASALEFAKSKFTSPETAKIILISDGAQTDGNAANAIRSIAADGVQVDTVLFNSEHGDEVAVVDVEIPDRNISVGDEFELGVTLKSSYFGKAKVTLFDNDAPVAEVEDVNFEKGTVSINIKHSYTLPGMHELKFVVENSKDTLNENNSFISYMFLQSFDKILIIESSDEGDTLDEILTTDYEYNVTRVTASDSEHMPATVDGLREYDQVILANIAVSDLPAGFTPILYDYVANYGGGLFTVGGANADGTPHAYDRDDLNGSEDGRLLHQMLPVQAIEYTPPIATVIIIDYSGSMSAIDSSTQKSFLELAKEGAKACLYALSDRDFCGVVALASDFSIEEALRPVTERRKIESAIDNISGNGGGTNYSSSLQRASDALAACKDVERRHIILVTDGQPGDPKEQYTGIIKSAFDKGITTSIFCVNGGPSQDIIDAATVGGGIAPNITDMSQLSMEMREDLKMEQIEGATQETFVPTIKTHTSVVTGVSQAVMPSLDGFFGTKAKPSAEVTLMGKYVPIYAQWRLGNGHVGSFMCDLNGVWSSDFVSAEAGKTIINNIVKGLFPTKDIRPKDIDAELKEDNYTTQVNVFTKMEEGQSLEATVTGPATESGEANVQTVTVGATEGYSRLLFTLKDPGLHEIKLRKLDKDGAEISSYTTYKAFSYSKEYNIFLTPEDAEKFMTELAGLGKGGLITEAEEVFRDVDETVHHEFDPRLPFIIIALILFLLDIAVRKFQFKWPHELIRDYRERREHNKK